MAKFYMVTTHPRLGAEKTRLEGVETWHQALDEALKIVADPLYVMYSLKGIELEKE